MAALLGFAVLCGLVGLAWFALRARPGAGGARNAVEAEPPLLSSTASLEPGPVFEKYYEDFVALIRASGLPLTPEALEYGRGFVLSALYVGWVVVRDGAERVPRAVKFAEVFSEALKPVLTGLDESQHKGKMAILFDAPVKCVEADYAALKDLRQRGRNGQETEPGEAWKRSADFCRLKIFTSAADSGPPSARRLELEARFSERFRAYMEGLRASWESDGSEPAL